MTDPKYPSLKLPQFSVRVEEELFNRIEAYCERNSLSKTEFARKAFEAILAKASKNNVQVASNAVTQEQFESLASKVEQLSSKLAQMGEIAA